MKTKAIYTFLITAVFVLTANKLSAQLDTMSYLKQFEANKANYIGQPFSKLLNEMTQIQPQTIWSYSGGRVKTKTIGSKFKFCDINLSFHNAVTMLIYWQESIPRDQSKYYEQKNAFYFTNDERAFYGNKIIKDILVYR